ncbi:MAG TPA: substrate-binding domain-containing protein [Hanamia sp.]|nr:substrate-binding domain-containing protein [Hanamia sp.]
MIGLNYRMISPLSIIFMMGLMWIFFAGCHENTRPDLDSPDKGTIHISVDEAFEPVIDSEIQVYEALHPGTKIIADYKPESECFKDLIKDSTKMIIVTRVLTPQEEQYYKDSISISPTWAKIAFGAVAVIVNRDSPDSIFSTNDLKNILDGSSETKLVPVFDGLQQTSTLRYIMDSVLRGKPLDQKRVFAEKNSEAVINYVANNKNALGFVGVSWIGNPEDTTQLSFLTKVRIASIECNICPEITFVKPYQANIMLMRYPMVQSLYYIIKEEYNGLASGFAHFMQFERGQLIFRRAYLWPARMNFTIRNANNY